MRDSVMEYDYLLKLRQTHPTWRLLNADSAPLIIGFLFKTFIEPNQRSLPETVIESRLDDYIYQVQRVYGEVYRRTPKEYLNQWVSGETPFLRKYYPDLGDEPEYDLTPATEKAIDWLQSLQQRQFIGAESRLLTVFRLLRDIVQTTESDPAERIRELEKQKEEIEAEIARLQRGIIESYEPTQVKECYYQVEDTARRLLSDFRQVEENFRQLDRQVREKIALSETSKGALLDEIFGEQDAIQDSDQGKSFRAFWALLMSQPRQDELQTLIDKVMHLQEVRSLEPDALLPRIKFHLMEAGDKVQQTCASLAEQLRKFLDDQAWLENKRIMDLIHEIEKQAIEIKHEPPPAKAFMRLAESRPAINLPMARKLFTPPRESVVEQFHLSIGEADIDLEALYRQDYIDESLLLENIRKAFGAQSQVSLADVCGRFPIARGLGEIVGYLNIASKDRRTVIDPTRRQTLLWQTDGLLKQATMDLIIFTR
jgi:flagellar motility protein MotE (MotC chaperone)